MVTVRITAEGRSDFYKLPSSIQGRAAEIFERLRQWPNVSGRKPLKRELKGAWRIRTDDYRILFKVNEQEQTITVFKIDNRKDVYE